MTSFTLVRELDRIKWLEFVHNHPNANIFQTPFIYDVFKDTINYNPIFLGLIDEKGEVLAVLVAVIQNFTSGIFKPLSSRAVIWGGPLVKEDDETMLEAILLECKKMVKGRALYTEIRNLKDNMSNLLIYKQLGYEFEEHLNIFIDLSKDEEELWKNVNPKGRNKIRKAQKEGSVFAEVNGIKSLEESYKILQEVYRRIRLPIPDKSLFISALNHSNKEFGLRIFVAKNRDKIIGVRLVLCYKDVIYEWYAGSYQKFKDKNPNDIIPWEVFMWGKKNEYKVFDFGGAGKPNIEYGVRDFKEKFGGQLVNYGRFILVHKPALFLVSKISFRFWQIIKSIKP